MGQHRHTSIRRDISRNASPILIEHVSAASSVKSQTPIFTPTLHSTMLSKPNNMRYCDRIVHTENVMTRSLLQHTRDDLGHFETEDDENSGDSDQQHLKLVIHVSEAQDADLKRDGLHHNDRVRASVSGSTCSSSSVELMVPPTSNSNDFNVAD